MAEIVRTVGRYELLDVLGRGGAGVVYRARQTDLGRLVAVKQLVDLRGGDSELVARFLREARLGGALTHPNIVPVYEYLEHEGSAYIAMELLPHGSLRAHIARLDLAQIGGVLEGMLAALSYASDRLVHRDIKPENVLVGGDGRVKLADFGIARAIDATSDPRLTTSDAIIGSPAYMAPEQASGGELGPWTDLFSAGVVAYELLVGERPYPRASTAAEALTRLVNQPIRRPLELRPSLDAGLAEWLELMLRKAPTERHRSATQAWDVLDEHLIRLLGERWRRASAAPVGPPADAPTPPARRDLDLASAAVDTRERATMAPRASTRERATTARQASTREQTGSRPVGPMQRSVVSARPAADAAEPIGQLTTRRRVLRLLSFAAPFAGIAALLALVAEMLTHR